MTPQDRSGDLGGPGPCLSALALGTELLTESCLAPLDLGLPHPRESQSPAKSKAPHPCFPSDKATGLELGLKLGMGEGQKHTIGAARTRPLWP